MEGLIEIKRLTVINIVDNETDTLSSPCSCMAPMPNIDSTIPDERPCKYTHEIATVLSDHKAFDFDYMCHAAHGLSLLLIAEYDEEIEIVGDDDDDDDDDDDGDDCDGDGNVQDEDEDEDQGQTRTRTRTKTKTKTKTSHLLFDGGPDPNVWRSNAKKLKVDLPSIETVVLSHYHVDHSNGLRAAVQDISLARDNERKKKDEHEMQTSKEKGKCLNENENENDGEHNFNYYNPLVVDLHKSKITTRGLKVRGKVYPMTPNNPTVEELEDLGGRCSVTGRSRVSVTLHKKEHLVGGGCFYVSGEIPRKTSFELGIPGHFRGLDDGNWVPDEDVLDERYVACKIRGRGIVVFSACSHAGIVNVCHDAVKKLNSSLTGVVGGFHLAGSSVDDRIDSTINGLKELQPEILLAGHCTGWRAKAKMYQAFEYNFQPLTVGGKYIFNSM